MAMTPLQKSEEKGTMIIDFDTVIGTYTDVSRATAGLNTYTHTKPSVLPTKNGYTLTDYYVVSESNNDYPLKTVMGSSSIVILYYERQGVSTTTTFTVYPIWTKA